MAQGDDRDASRLTSRVASGVRWSLFDQGVQQGVRLVVTVVLAALIAPRDFGVFGMALVVTNFASVFAGLGLGPALMYRRSVTDHDVTVAFTASAGFGLFTGLVVAASASVIAGFFDEPRLSSVLLVLSALFLFRGAEGVPNDMLRRHLLLRQFALSSTIAAVVGGTLGVVSAALGLELWALVVYVLSESFLAVSLGWAFAWRAGVWRPRIGFRWSTFRGLFGYSRFVAAQQIVSYGATDTDNLIVGRFLGSAALGYYSLAYRVMLFPVIRVVDVIGRSVLPAFAIIREDLSRLSSAYLRAVRFGMLVAAPVSIGIAVTAPLAVDVVLGEEWRPAVTTMQILALNGPRMALVRLNGAIYQSTGRPEWDLWTTIGAVACYVPSFLIGVQHGIAGVAIAFTVTGHLFALLPLYLGARALSIRVADIVESVLPVLAATTALTVAVVLASEVVAGAAPAVQLAVAVLAGAAGYAGWLLVFAPGIVRDAARTFTGRGAG